MKIITNRILSFSTPRFKIRVWLSVDEDYTYKFGEMTKVEIAAQREWEMPLEQLAKKLCEVEGVLQAEVLDWDNNGVVCGALSDE